MISAIVCVDKNWGIGYQGELLAKIPEDMKRFKVLTIGQKKNAVVMGRRTYDSLQVKPLKDRINIVITKNVDECELKNTVIYSSMDFAKKLIASFNERTDKDIFIIGGGQIYKELLQYCNRVYLTKIFEEYKADTYFPNIEEREEWTLINNEELKEYNGVWYQFSIYDKEVK